jgi:hypothetical protein
MTLHIQIASVGTPLFEGQHTSPSRNWRSAGCRGSRTPEIRLESRTNVFPKAGCTGDQTSEISSKCIYSQKHRSRFICSMIEAISLVVAPLLDSPRYQKGSSSPQSSSPACPTQPSIEYVGRHDEVCHRAPGPVDQRMVWATGLMPNSSRTRTKYVHLRHGSRLVSEPVSDASSLAIFREGPSLDLRVKR